MILYIRVRDLFHIRDITGTVSCIYWTITSYEIYQASLSSIQSKHKSGAVRRKCNPRNAGKKTQFLLPAKITRMYILALRQPTMNPIIWLWNLFRRISHKIDAVLWEGGGGGVDCVGPVKFWHRELYALQMLAQNVSANLEGCSTVVCK